MTEQSYEQKIMEHIHLLDTEKQREVLEFVRSLVRPRGEPGKLMFERTSNVYINPADLEEMQQAIEEAC